MTTAGPLKSRPATAADAECLVDFVLMAGEGLPDRVWAEMAEPGESLREVGLRRASRSEGAFSYTNATLFEQNGRVVGGLVGYKLPDTPEPIGEDFPPEFVPLQELENLACGTWYVNILGVYDDARGQGVGTAMLARAEANAASEDARGLSIIVFSSNPGAEKLYRNVGYVEVARRTMNMPGWRHDGCEAILLVKHH